MNSEELYTVLCDCEAVVNARPLTYTSDVNNELIPLTPAMFLHEIRDTTVPDCDLVDSSFLKGRLIYIQTLRDNLQKRFRIEYLGQLKNTFKRKDERRIALGDIVLIGDDMRRRNNWPLDWVVELLPGKDQ